VICGKNESGEYQVINEFTDQLNTITGLLEFNNRLISCGIDKNMVIYDIIESKDPPIVKRHRSDNFLMSCFTSKKK
jgi:hypothetical protein